MVEIKQLSQIISQPGIKRDGPVLDGVSYTDGQWVRFQRGKPKKIGGYYRISNNIRGPIYTTLVWSKSTLNNVYGFHTHGIQMIQVDTNGVGSHIIDRTPSPVDFTANPNILWSVDTMYDAAAGSAATFVLALPASLLEDMDSQVERSLYVGNAAGVGAFTKVTDVNAVASGGVFVTTPYAVLYGNDGKVTWSNTNEPQNYTSGDAGTARPTGSKIIKGASLRSGSGPAGLLWSLDSVMRMDWVGGGAVFKFSTLSRNSSILAAGGVVEYDGTYFWVGRDRFMVCDGSKVNELPNDVNLNWFFDGLNHEHSNKVWGMKIPRYGEIWWFFPKGDATECSHAVIFNIREKTWYDIELARSAGYHQVAFNYPIMAGQESDRRRFLSMTTLTGSFYVGDIVTGATSGASGTIYLIDGTNCYITLNSTTEFIEAETISTTSTNITLSAISGVFNNGDTVTDGTAIGKIYLVTGATYHIVVMSGVFSSSGILTNTSQTGSATINSLTVCTATSIVYDELYSLFTHEHGRDAVTDISTAIESWVTTANIGLPTGGAQHSTEGLNQWTRLIRIEPDVTQVGDMTVEILGKEFANSPETIDGPYTFDNTTLKIDMRVQRRHLRLKFKSNTTGGFYEMGKTLLHLEPGDNRS